MRNSRYQQYMLKPIIESIRHNKARSFLLTPNRISLDTKKSQWTDHATLSDLKY